MNNGRLTVFVIPGWLLLLWIVVQAFAIFHWIDMAQRIHAFYLDPMGVIVLGYWCFLICRGLYRWRRSRPA